MKRTLSIAIAIFFLLLPGVSRAQACNTVDIDSDIMSKSAMITAIEDALSDYQQGGVYGICFDMHDEALLLGAADISSSFLLEIPEGESHDVYIEGLMLDNYTANPVSHEFIKVVNNGSGTVTIDNISLSDIKNGLLLEGGGKTEVKSSTIAGDTSKSGNCIEIASAGAVLNGVQASGCGDGVKVDADDVSITNGSVIKGHKIGVHIMSGAEKTDVSGSLIYYNDDGDDGNLRRFDGIRIEDDALHEIVFYDIVDDEPVPLLEGENIIEYEAGPAYLLMDIPDGKTGVVEFFISEEDEEGGCDAVYSFKQACTNLDGMTNPVSIKSSVMAYGPVRVTIPPEHLDKTVVAVYTDPDRGTAGISRQFSLSENSGGVVAFVSSPYDIPTTSGLAGDDAAPSMPEEEDDGGGSGIGGDGIGTEGGDGVIEAAGGVAGGCGGGGASLAGDSFRTVALLMDLWWNLLLVGVILGVRKAFVRVRDKR